MPLKLKRKLVFKGYVFYQLIRPASVLTAVQWLIQNNPLYSDVTVNDDWLVTCINDETADMFNASPATHVDDAAAAAVDDVLMTTSTPSNDPSTEASSQPAATSTSNTQETQQSNAADHVPCDATHSIAGDVPPLADSPTDSDTDTDSDSELTQKVRGLKFNTCLHPSSPQNAVNDISVAPAEGQTPLDFMMDKNAEMLAFPGKFPLGRGGLTDNRDITVTPSKYFVQRILNCDKRFASDANYLFFAQYVTEMKHIRDSITIALRKSSGRITANDVTNAAQIRQLIKKDTAYQFLQSVRGSPAYYQHAVKELIAMVTQLGCPQFFLTLSAADMSWPELFKIIGQQNGQQYSDADISAMTYEQKSTMLRNDPVLAARHFDFRLRSFFTDIIQHTLTFGKLKTYNFIE